MAAAKRANSGHLMSLERRTMNIASSNVYERHFRTSVTSSQPSSIFAAGAIRTPDPSTAIRAAAKRMRPRQDLAVDFAVSSSSGNSAGPQRARNITRHSRPAAKPCVRELRGFGVEAQLRRRR